MAMESKSKRQMPNHTPSSPDNGSQVGTQDWVEEVDLDALAKKLLELMKQELRRERERR